MGIALACFAAGSATAQDDVWARPSFNFSGVPGLVDMPTANPANDADLTLTIGNVGPTIRGTLHFQITPRLSGVFRYASMDGLYNNGSYYDRSFDLAYLVAEEGRYTPAVTLGLQDFGGTGIMSGEYIVATKTFGRLRATGGVGWGRFGSYNGFTNPLAIFGNGAKVRNPTGIVTTGQLSTKQWFRGDAALFGGLQYAVNDRLVLSAEYSSDDYAQEVASRDLEFQHRSPFNFGASYQFKNGLNLSGAYMYGSTFGVKLSYTFNPKHPSKFPGGIGNAPAPIQMRPQTSAVDLGWTRQANGQELLRANVKKLFTKDGLFLEAMGVEPYSATVRFRTGQYASSANAVGHAARILANLMPYSVETFVLIPVSANGIPLSRVTLKRSDLEELEHAPDGSWKSFARAEISDAYPVDRSLEFPADTFPKFDWSYGPSVQSVLFDRRSPVRLDVGVQASARYEPTPGLVFSGLARVRLWGDTGKMRLSTSVLPHVRTDAGNYAKEGEFAIKNLTIAKYFRPGPDLYGRVTVGYLETMYAGVSGELLWKPVDSRLALGVEVNLVQQREFKQHFGLRDYQIATGHVSAYYDGKNGYNYQLDVGRYLAGDWGGTLSMEREFKNGVRLGVFATLTDVSFDDFAGKPIELSAQNPARNFLFDGRGW